MRGGMILGAGSGNLEGRVLAKRPQPGVPPPEATASLLFAELPRSPHAAERRARSR